MKTIGSALTSLVILLAAFLVSTNLAQADISGAIGGIEPPPGVEEQNADFLQRGGGDSENNIAIFFFFNKFIKVLNIVAGLWVLISLTIASYTYITSQGKAEAHQKVRDKLTMSVIGLALLVVAYMAIAILSNLFFGDAGFILNPTLTTES